MHYNFEWDPIKAKTNLKKHGISFDSAAEIFFDPLHITVANDTHGDIEKRWITLGSTKAQKLRIVVHTFMQHHSSQVTIRIISARPATKHEQKQYEEL